LSIKKDGPGNAKSNHGNQAPFTGAASFGYTFVTIITSLTITNTVEARYLELPVASYADALWARHAIFLLRDEPKEDKLPRETKNSSKQWIVND